MPAFERALAVSLLVGGVRQTLFIGSIELKRLFYLGKYSREKNRYQ